MDLLTLQGVEVGYHRRRILPAVDLTIRRGTYLGIVGPNGSGKTTLVRTLLGLLPPVAGRIVRPEGRAPRFGYVPQRPDERGFPIATLDMVLMGRFHRVGLVRRVGATDRALALKALERVGLGAMAERPLHMLSGGQRQRALIARALATEPEVLVLDEPTTGMDVVAEQALLDLVEEVRAELKLAVVMISHQLGLVANSVSEVLLVDRDRDRVIHGAVGEVVTAEALTELYRKKIAVTHALDHLVVFVDRRKPEDAP
jgi:ABC-type Mn2+/Zn2+ transport system ATPase subunit